jgi:AsmA protein
MALMKKTLKILLWLILALVILLGLAAFALVKLVNPNDFKPQIIAAVNNATGRQLNLPGELSWTFYPEVGIHLGNASLSNPDGFSQNTFAQIDSADLAVSFWGLVHGNVEFNTLNLNGLRVFLIQEKNQNNWTFPAMNDEKVKDAAGVAAAANSSKKSYGLSIQSIAITDGGISFDNYQAKSHYALDGIDLNANNVGLGQTFPLSFSANYNVNQNMTGSFKVDSQVNFDASTKKLALTNLALETSLVYPTNTGSLKITNNISGDINADLNAQTISAPSLDIAINQILTGQITNFTVANFSNPQFSGSLNTKEFSLKDLLSSIGMSPIPVANKNMLDQVSLQAQFSGSTSSLNLSNVILNLAKSELNGDIKIASFSPLRLSENIKVDQIDLADIVNLKGARLPMQNITSSGSISLAKSNNAVYPRTLNGSIGLNVENITLKGFDVEALINKLTSIINNIQNTAQLATVSSQVQQQVQQTMSTQGINANNGQSTNFGTLNAKININQGNITTPVMTLNGPIVRVSGSGNVNLVAQAIDYDLDAKVVSSNNSFLKGLVIPYHIGGSFDHITQGLNWISLQAQILKFLMIQLQQAVQNTVKTTVQQTLQQVQNGGQGASDLGNTAAKALNSIFGGQSN